MCAEISFFFKVFNFHKIYKNQIIREMKYMYNKAPKFFIRLNRYKLTINAQMTIKVLKVRFFAYLTSEWRLLADESTAPHHKQLK